MSDYEVKVRQFHEAMGVAVADVPTLADAPTRRLRCRLLLEEVFEFITASGCYVAFGHKRWDIASLPEHEQPTDAVAMAQELADVQYVTSGAAITFGLPMAAVFNEVHAANMRKVGPDGKVERRPDGKVVKPPGWRGPDVAAVLAGTK